MSFTEQPQGLPIIDTETQSVNCIDILKPSENPLLRPREVLFTKALVRKANILLPATNSGEARMQGISLEAQKVLQNMIVSSSDRKKRDFTSMIASVNALNPSSGFCTNPINMLESGIKGDLSTVIENVSRGEGNCFEFNLIMQLIGKVYYSDEIKDVQLLPYETVNNMTVGGHSIPVTSRHFLLFNTCQTASGLQYELTAPGRGGRTRVVTRGDIMENVLIATNTGRADMKSIYKGVITLIDLAEKNESNN